MTVDTLELIQRLKSDLQELERGVLQERHARQHAEERYVELEQLADPHNDGQPFTNRMGKNQWNLT